MWFRIKYSNRYFINIATVNLPIVHILTHTHVHVYTTRNTINTFTALKRKTIFHEKQIQGNSRNLQPVKFLHHNGKQSAAGNMNTSKVYTMLRVYFVMTNFCSERLEEAFICINFFLSKKPFHTCGTAGGCLFIC